MSRQPEPASPDRTRGGSSLTASATRSGSPSGRPRTRSGSATWAGTRGRRSTSSRTRPAASPTTAGRATRAPAAVFVRQPQCRHLRGPLAAPAGTVTAPYFTYNHGVAIAGETCPTANGSSISGLAFYTGGSYPASYAGGLFFADYSRDCIWFMPAGANGRPNGAGRQVHRGRRQPGLHHHRTRRRPVLRRLRRRDDPPGHVRVGQPAAECGGVGELRPAARRRSSCSSRAAARPIPKAGL